MKRSARATQTESLQAILSNFQIEGRLLEIAPNLSGHINDTYLSRFTTGRSEQRYVHQRINRQVFKEPDKVMGNIERVTRHARSKILAAGGDPQRETLTLVPTLDGKSFHRTPEGETWRTYINIERASTYDRAENLQQVYSAALAFGHFQKMMSTLPGESLHETIPNFHHTRKRFQAFVKALEDDACNRAKRVQTEIEFILQRAGITGVIVDLLAQGAIPERVTHNDTKLNNVLIDDLTGKGICVIDLDTVMPGSALYDFGDLVRVGACPAAEDENDLGKVRFDMDMFACLAQGYLDAASSFLTPPEIDHLAFAARLITLEQAMRFLGDYLNGDVYYKIHHPGHNLERARTQIKLVTEIEVQLERMQTSIERFGR